MPEVHLACYDLRRYEMKAAITCDVVWEQLQAEGGGRLLGELCLGHSRPDEERIYVNWHGMTITSSHL